MWLMSVGSSYRWLHWILPGVVRVVLERHERQVGETAVRVQVVEKPPEPRRLPLRIRPHLDVVVDAFEHRPAQLQRGIDAMERRGELQIERAVVLGQHVLPIRLFAHLDPRDRVAACLQIGDLGGRILGRAVEHRDRNHRGQSARVAARVEEIESDLLARRRADVGRLVPRIDRRADGGRLVLVGRVADEIVELATGGPCVPR